MGNTSGQAYALTVITPVLDGHEAPLRKYLAELPVGSASPLARMGTTHFARWLVLHDLVYQGAPQVRDTLHSPYLLFTSNFDGKLEDYIDSMLRVMSTEADAVWSHCVGYPGISDDHAFLGYLRHNQLETEFFFSAYPDASVADVRGSLKLRERFTGFAINAQGLDAVALQEQFVKEFADGGAL